MPRHHPPSKPYVLPSNNGQLTAGPAKPLVIEDNQILPLDDGPPPKPPVPSIYEWQLNHAKN